MKLTMKEQESMDAMHVHLASLPRTKDGRIWSCSCSVCRATRKVCRERFKAGRLFALTPEGKLLTAIFEEIG